MDTVFRKSGLAALLLAVAVLAGSLFPAGVAVASSNSSYDAAFAQCMAVANSGQYNGLDNPPCTDGSSSDPAFPGCVVLWWAPAGPGYKHSLNGCFSYTGAPPSQCGTSTDGDDTPTSTWLVGKILNGYTSCESQQSATTGQWVQCGHSMQPASPPYYDPQLGAWRTKVTAAATHALCGTQSSSSPISQTWQASDGTAIAAANAPPGPPTPYNTTNPPRVCGGGSCYDPNTDQYCATSNGQQVCVPGPTARTAGGCSASGGGTLCSGSPSSPSPPASSVPDPATDIRSVDKTQQADTTTGAPLQVTTTVYATGNTQTASGQHSGDSGPANGGQGTTGNQAAHASSAGGNGTYSGGTDCNTPPICTGDAVLCGASRAQWATTCQVHKDLAGTLPAPSSSALANGSAYDQTSIWSDTTNVSSGDPLADAARQGHFDETGYGIGVQCPMKDFTITFNGQSMNVPLSNGCVIGPWVRGVVIAFALFFAVKISG